MRYNPRYLFEFDQIVGANPTTPIFISSLPVGAYHSRTIDGLGGDSNTARGRSGWSLFLT